MRLSDKLRRWAGIDGSGTIEDHAEMVIAFQELTKYERERVVSYFRDLATLLKDRRDNADTT